MCDRWQGLEGGWGVGVVGDQNQVEASVYCWSREVYPCRPSQMEGGEGIILHIKTAVRSRAPLASSLPAVDPHLRTTPTLPACLHVAEGRPVSVPTSQSKELLVTLLPAACLLSEHRGPANLSSTRRAGRTRVYSIHEWRTPFGLRLWIKDTLLLLAPWRYWSRCPGNGNTGDSRMYYLR